MGFDDIYKWYEYLLELVEAHKTSLDAQLEATLNSCSRFEITSEGKNLGYRGNYNPSLFIQNMVSNVKKGRVYKKRPANLLGTYEIGFDKENKIIYSRHNDSSDENMWVTHELIWYTSNEQYSIVWQENCANGNSQMVSFTLLHMDHGQPHLYMLVSYNEATNQTISFEVEEYVYRYDLLYEIVYHMVGFFGSTKEANKYAKEYGVKLYDGKVYLTNKYKV